MDINMRKYPDDDHPFPSRSMSEAMLIPESTIRSYLKRMKKSGATDIMVRPLDAYYVDQLNADFSKNPCSEKKESGSS